MTDPFQIAAIAALILAGLLVVRWAIARHALTKEARAEYEARASGRAATVAGVASRDFTRLYVAASEPRWTLYAAGALVGAVIVTPPALLALWGLWDVIRAATGASDLFAPGYYPWMFYMFFGLVGAWAVCGAIAARLFHARCPEPFQAALARARGEPLEDTPVRRARPKWARRVRPDPG